MNDVAVFYRLMTTVNENEIKKKEAQKALKQAYAELVPICPHSEAIDWTYNSHTGVYRVCKICGLEDLASQGGTDGDEYNYGYAGSPNRAVWKNSTVEKAKSENEHWEYRRQHGWRVRNGKAVNSFA